MLDIMAFFVYVIRTGSISAAARKFNISVSAGSRWLQDLEQTFGITLCRRTNRTLSATPAGQKLVDEFAPLVDTAEQLCRSLQDYQEQDKGHIDIACTPVYANNFLMEKISDYITSHPNVTFNLNVTPWALDHAAEADLVISANACYQGYKEKDLHLVRRELMQCPFVAVASPDYLHRHGVPQDPAELSQHLCLFSTTLTGSNDWFFEKNGETQMIKVPKSLEVNDSDLLLQSAIKGAGIAYLPAFILDRSLSHGQLLSILEDYDTSLWSLNLYYHPPTTASAVASHFKSYLLAKT